jgi:uncharacterized protein YdeI (YjbR/CyaY-like superfamily)
MEKKFASRAQWRAWLEKNHDRVDEIWIIFVKAHSDKRRFTYAEAVEEALCFGWIDTTVRKIDDDHFMQRFTPRTNLKNWSKINLGRFERMEAAGLMTDAGRAKRPAQVDPPKKRLQVGAPVPDWLEVELAKHPKAKAFFETLAPGYRRDYLRYITEAKKHETRMRRLEEALKHLNAGEKRWI